MRLKIIKILSQIFDWIVEASTVWTLYGVDPGGDIPGD